MEPLNHRDELSLRKDLDAWRGSLSYPHNFYLVTTTSVGSSGNPIDTIFGEPINSFGETEIVTSAYAPFQASLYANPNNVTYGEEGFVFQPQVRIEVNPNVTTWELGNTILVDGSLYRVTDMENGGLVTRNRIILTLDKVT